MKKKYIALIMIVMAACFGTLALPSPAAKPAADTTVSVEYLQQIEQQNQRMSDSVALLRMEQQLAEYVEKKADRNMNLNIGLFGGAIAISMGLFGALMTLMTCVVGVAVPLIINRSQRKKLDETAKKLDETARKSKQAVADIDQLKTTIQEYSKQAKESVQEANDSAQKAQKSANEAKALTYFAEALKEEDLDRQIDLYTWAIEINPEYTDAYNNRGLAYDDKGKLDNAIKDYTNAIKINPNFAYAYNNRGYTYCKKGKYDKAIEDSTKAIEINSNNAEAYDTRGNAYNGKGEYDKAIKDCTRAIGINPNLAEAYNTRGEANKGLAEKMEAKGKTEEALELFKAAVKDFDKFLELYTKDDEKRKSAIRRKQECEEAIRRLGGGKK